MAYANRLDPESARRYIEESLTESEEEKSEVASAH
jgi:hypothetical protein